MKCDQTECGWNAAATFDVQMQTKLTNNLTVFTIPQIIHFLFVDDLLSQNFFSLIVTVFGTKFKHKRPNKTVPNSPSHVKKTENIHVRFAYVVRSGFVFLIRFNKIRCLRSTANAKFYMNRGVHSQSNKQSDRASTESI